MDGKGDARDGGKCGDQVIFKVRFVVGSSDGRFRPVYRNGDKTNMEMKPSMEQLQWNQRVEHSSISQCPYKPTASVANLGRRFAEILY